jgi:hypothetical protein
MIVRGAICLLGACAVLLLGHAARADAIDGSWCHEPSKRLTIDGPTIVTPGGNAIRGDYSRHYFSYVIPDNEPQAGTTMQMRLLSEEMMQMRAGPEAPVETWHRCSPATS